MQKQHIYCHQICQTQKNIKDPHSGEVQFETLLANILSDEGKITPKVQ